MGICNEDVRKRVVGLIDATPGAEMVGADAGRMCFCGKAPRRTFEVICEDVGGFRVKETTGFQTAGRQPTAYGERDVINESKMIDWVTAQLKELRAA